MDFPEWVVACILGDVDACRRLIHADNVNTLVYTLPHHTDAYRPLSFALMRCLFSCAEYLVSVGARVQPEDHVVLVHVAGSLNIDWVRFLLKGGADPNTRIDRVGTPLSQAVGVWRNNAGYPGARVAKEIARELLLAGANWKTLGEKKRPDWLMDCVAGIHICKQAVAAVIGIRRFGRSALLQPVPREVVMQIARNMFETRGNDLWWMELD